MSIIRRGLMIWMFLLMSSLAQAQEMPTIEIDFAKTSGKFRALHGINKGTLAAGGLIDVTEPIKALGVPFVRLHDCHWPNPDVVDIHAVFPNWNADPERPESYDFRLTDEYIAAIRKTGAQIIYRLGESIEHTSVKRFVHPPADMEKWAKIALGIVRHYNEGWANGFRYGVRYWEIWNEPENRPAMWTGTDADYFQLYRTTAKMLTARYPELKIGGPAVGFSGEFKGGEFVLSPFVTQFLKMCRDEGLPLDFFSWHCYTNEPMELVKRATAIRQNLNALGFAKTESHLTEWNYLPDNSWAGLARDASPEVRQQFYERQAGNEGAAFLLNSLLLLQDAPVDVCCVFHGETSGFGLFNENGIPGKNYKAIKFVQRLKEFSERIAVHGLAAGKIAVGAARDKSQERTIFIVSNADRAPRSVRLALKNFPWDIVDSGVFQSELYSESERDQVSRVPFFFKKGTVVVRLPQWSFLQLTLFKRPPRAEK